VKRYTAKFNETPYYHTAASYAAFRLLVEAVRSVGRLDREAIRNWLHHAGRFLAEAVAAGPCRIPAGDG